MTRFHAWMAAVMILASTSATAYDNYQPGRISNVAVYTDARTGGGYCQINQIDPPN